MPITIDVLSYFIYDGQREREMFIGAMPVDELHAVAGVPSFSSSTDQHVIAANVLRPPIKDWQRPPDPTKVSKISSRFSAAGEFMPNPVLLAVQDTSAVKVEPKLSHQHPTGIHTITIEDGGSEKPLWILDGQHRVSGLAGSTRSHNPIPFVLLYSDSPTVYQPQDFARIFAEVSTEATPLHDLHREWLQFAFRLDKYDPDAPGAVGTQAPAHITAMKAVAILCENQTFHDGAVPNPYFNKVQFNPNKAALPAYGNGFAFTAPLLKELVHDEYYKQPAVGSSHLEPEELAAQLALATLALTHSIVTPEDQSAFSGTGNKHHQYIERAFICGVLSRLLTDPQTDWESLFSDLKFTTTNWNLTWVRTTGGRDGTVSKAVARSVFVEAFRNGAVPHEANDLATYLRGDKASITLEASFLTEAGRPARGNKRVKTIPIGGIDVFETEGRPHIKLLRSGPHTSNVGKLDIYDPDDPRGDRFTARTLRAGVVLEDQQELVVHGLTYGGLRRDIAPLTINPG